MKTRVILLSAKAQHGKDYTANLLKCLLEKQNKKVLVTHYADLLKYICKAFFGWDGKKDEAGRTLLQSVGTDTIRKQNPDYWVKFIENIITMFPGEWDYILIPDTRFPNEIEVMKQNKSFETITVRISRINFKSTLTEEQQVHESETALDDYKFDYYIINDSTNAGLEAAVFNLVDSFNGKKNLFVDFDCTLVNTIKAIVSLYDEDFKHYPNYNKIQWEDIFSWDFRELEATTQDYINHYFNQERFFDRLELFEGALEAMNELNEKYNIKIVSHGHTPNLKIKEKYVNKYFPYAQFIGVNLENHTDKSNVDMTNGIFIDDSFNNLKTSNAEIKICFGETYEWNQEFDSSYINCFDAFDWEAVKTLLL